MQKVFTGKTIVVGDNIDTDQIYPGCYLALTDPKEIASHCLAGVDERIAGEFLPGGMIVAGRNFGCGSSREHAPIALIHMGAAAVIADSFARIFYRNAINLGLPLIVCRDAAKKIREGSTITLDMEQGTVTVLETGQVLECQRLGGQALEILEAGGIKPLMRAKFAGEQGG